MFISACLYRGYWELKLLYLGELPKHVWMYWQDMPGVKKPGYIELTLKTAVLHNQGSFQVHVLNEKNIHEYLPNMRKDLIDKLNLPQRADYYRVALLEKYGGIWLDADTVVMQDLTPLLNLLRYHDFVGFGCNYSADECKKNLNGFPYPCNWVMLSRAKTKLLAVYKQKQDEILDQHEYAYFQRNYHAIGKEQLIKAIDYVKQEVPYWSYKHYTSRCVERDSQGVLWNNVRLLSTETIDNKCLSDLIFVPFYNNSSPKWFRNMSAEQVQKADYLFSKMIRFALSK
ncbi:MAG: hypothetical protein H8E74_01460 [Gammaproteobacteria bacterium]|nr:hypothetical protein [Gammaproteobacteria bacterium]